MGRIADAGHRLSGRVVTVPPVPDLPPGRMLELPGRGRTFVLDTGPARDPATNPDRPTIVLLHALACTGLLTWYPCLDALRARHRVVVFDQRWHGQGIRSSRLRLEDCADDVVALADVLGLERIVPVGYSMGSLVAQLVAHRHADRVAGAVFAASTTRFREAEPLGLRIVAARLAAAAERRLGAAPVLAQRSELADDAAWALAQFRATSRREITGALAVLSRFDSRGWIGELRMPTAVVITAKDRAIRPSRQRELARLLPEATGYEVAAGHAACVLRADRFRPALLAATASVFGRCAAPAAGSSAAQH